MWNKKKLIWILYLIMPIIFIFVILISFIGGLVAAIRSFYRWIVIYSLEMTKIIFSEAKKEINSCN